MLVLAIISTSSIFMFPAGLLMCVSGILGIVGTSIVICCGPSNPGEGSGKLKCCAILCIIAAVFHLIGLILMIVVYAVACAETERTWGGGSCAVYTGWLIIIIIDGLISVGAGVLEVVCAVKCMAASTVLAIPYEGSQVATATGVATNAVVATAVVAAAPPASSPRRSPRPWWPPSPRPSLSLARRRPSPSPCRRRTPAAEARVIMRRRPRTRQSA